MIYLSTFEFPSFDEEYRVRLELKRTCYNTMYPFFVLSGKGFERMDLAPVTILYGGNGSGKTTALNVIAEKLSLRRDTLYNRSSFFEDYTRMCAYEATGVPEASRIVTSDDVFDYMLQVRSLNEGIDRRRETLLEEYTAMKYASFRMRSLDDYEQMKKVCLARSKTQSEYVRKHGAENVREQSNGESAWFYFTSRMAEAGLYLLDEPENSLSPARQLELVRFLEDSARFFDCQFVIATHSPFLLSMRGAKIYNLDESPVCVRKWTQIGGVRAYYDFFKEREEEFR